MAEPELSGEVTVFAAASLTAAFDQLKAQFESDHPGVTVSITYDGSSTLATQLTGGAVADVFASADDKNMTTVVDAGLAKGGPVYFATNSLQIAVEPGNPLGITGLADIVKPDVLLVLCAPEVPCGSAAQKALTAAGLSATPVSEEQNVKAVLTKVQSGEADAGLVYSTDVRAAEGGVDGVEFPEAASAVNNYPIVTLGDAPNANAAAAFEELVLSKTGQTVLADLGFGPAA